MAAGELLEQMKELAELAQDETLFDEHRLAIRIKMGGLQHELDCETEMFRSAYMTGEAKVSLGGCR